MPVGFLVLIQEIGWENVILKLDIKNIFIVAVTSKKPFFLC